MTSIEPVRDDKTALATTSFDARPYAPDGGAEPQGLLMLTCALGASGMLLGALASYVSQWFYLILIFPLGIGALVGAVGARVCHTFKVRNPWAGGAAGFLAGVLAMATMHYCDYQRQQSVLAELSAKTREFFAQPAADRQAELESLAPEERAAAEAVGARLAVHSFVDYMDAEAREGVSLKRAGRDKGVNLGYVGSWIYWAIETLLVAALAVSILRATCAEPFCRPCSAWKTSRGLGFLDAEPAQAAEAVRSGKLTQVLACKPGQQAGKVALIVTLASCDKCKSAGPVDVKLEQLTVTKKGEKKLKLRAHVRYPGQALTVLPKLFA